MTDTVTPVFRVSSSRYAAVEAKRWLARIGWIPAIAVLVALIAAMYDSRFLYVALMLVFVVYPMILTLAWLSLISRPLVIRRQQPQSWTIHCDGSVTVSYFDPDGNQTGTEFIPHDAVSEVDNGDKYITLHLMSAPSDGIIMIPASLAPQDLTDRYDKQID